MVARHGRLAHASTLGVRDRERGKPVADDTIWRIYSMTKPITGVALLTLLRAGPLPAERPGRPVHPRVRAASRCASGWRTGPSGSSTPSARCRVRDALMHMTGHRLRPDRAPGSTWPPSARSAVGARLGKGATLRDARRAAGRGAAALPPRHALAVLVVDRRVRPPGRGRSRAARSTTTCRRRSSSRSAWSTPGSGCRTTAPTASPPCYARDRRQVAARCSTTPSPAGYRRPADVPVRRRRAAVGTAADYLRFAQMLANGGELDGARILGRKTVELMASNHLPGGGDLRASPLPGGYGEVGLRRHGLRPHRGGQQGPGGHPGPSARPASTCGAARRRRSSGSTRPRSWSWCS